MTTINQKHYLIETETVGPASNWQHTVEIDTRPATWYGDVVTDGLIAEITGTAYRAHGAYDTIDAAREAIKDKWIASVSAQEPWGGVVETYTIRRERKTPRRKRT